jgi:hypothetical protein
MKSELAKSVENVQFLLEKLPMVSEGDEKEFRRAVWSLCQQVRQSQTNLEGGQFVPLPLMG